MKRVLLERNDTAVIRRPRYLKYGVGIVAVAGLLALVVASQAALRSSTLAVARDDLIVATATSEAFSPTVRVVAEVVAADPVVVTALDGGIVARILRRNGDYVRVGEPILLLQNAAVGREVADGRSRLTAQLGDLVATEAQIQGQLQTSESAVRDARYRLDNAERDLTRQEALAERGFASTATLERVRADRAYAQDVLEATTLALDGARRDGAERLARLATVRRNVEDLLGAQANRLDALTVRAAAGGRLTGLEATVGAPVSASQVLGRIEDDTQLEVIARLPESRQRDIRIGGLALGEIDGRPVEFTIREIDPTVTDGQVRLRLAFVGETPDDLRLGQSLPLQVSVGASRQAVVVPAGSAVGPARAFIVDWDMARAQPVRLGERSGSRIEIVEGVAPGDKVVISAPAGIENADVLRISGR